MPKKDFVQLLEQNNLNKLGLSTGIDSYIKKYEKQEPDAIFKVSELLPDTLKTPSFEKFSDNLLIKMDEKVFAYQPPTEHHVSAISKPFNDNEMARKLEDALKMRKLTQQRKNEYSKRQEEIEKTKKLSTLEMQEISVIKKSMQKERIVVATKMEDYKNKKLAVEQLEETLEIRQNQKRQLEIAITDIWHDTRVKKECKNDLQKEVLEHETKLRSIKDEIGILNDLQNFRQQNNENKDLKDYNSDDKLQDIEKPLSPVTLEMGDK